MTSNRHTGRWAAVALTLGALSGCATPREQQAKPVADAWQQSRSQPPAGAEAPSPDTAVPATVGEPIARVDGRPIGRERFLDLLIAGRGVSVLDELIVLDLARHEAEQRNLVVSESDLEAERDRTLRSLLSTLPAADAEHFDRRAAEAVLDNILFSRGISRQEFDIGTLRNAYLRRLADAGLTIAQDDIQAEYLRVYGERVRVRHIQLLSAADAQQVQQQLEAGADFAELARRHSANPLTAPGGGLLEPFGRADPAVPALLREAAFRLQKGDVSNAIRVDNWYHLLKIEDRLPAVEVPLEQVRGELERRARDRLLEVEVQRLSADLFSRARVEIADAALAADFFKQHPELRRSIP